jgi:hypothetical protein
MLTANTAARAFHDRLGFQQIPVPAHEGLTFPGLEVGPNAWLGANGAG